jgi:cell wall-associated NlpC family hydrolase
MNKKFAAIGVMALTLTTCASPANGEIQKPTVSNVVSTSHMTDGLKDFMSKVKVMNNTTKLNKAISNLRKYVNKTWYVYSGNTPSGWDCSGLTMWVYKQLGINLIHSASVQKNSGKIHKTPKIGDIVAFGWKGWSGAAHVGIYVGNGMMINAPSPGHRTTLQSVKSFAKYGYSKVTYTRIVQTN